MILYSLDWLLPWLASAHNTSPVEVKVVILFRVSEFLHDIAMSEHVGSQKGNANFGVPLGLGWGEWEYLESLSAQQVISEE